MYIYLYIYIYICKICVHDRNVQLYPIDRCIPAVYLTGEQLQGGGQRQADVGRSDGGGGALDIFIVNVEPFDYS